MGRSLSNLSRPLQGRERALKTNILIFIMSVSFLDNLISCLRDIYCILSAKNSFIWTGCMVLWCMEPLITVTTSAHPLISAKRVGTWHKHLSTEVIPSSGIVTGPEMEANPIQAYQSTLVVGF